jgi:iron-sulfur cluster repair protein YtfE (RIC family)
MTTPLTPSRALETLAAQHATLRENIYRCEVLADEVDAGTAEAAALVHEVAQLRKAFDDHNQFEEQLLRPLLLDVEWLGAVRVSRMVEDHVEEHRAMRRGLAETASATATPSPTGELRGVLANLLDHLATEERHFLSRKVLRDDLAG